MLRHLPLRPCFITRSAETITEYSAFIAGIGTAAQCVAAKYHAPRPLRYVWHHVLPRSCGGKTVAANLVDLCDNCHYGVHILLFELAHNNGRLTTHSSMSGIGRYLIAKRGYDAAVAAGTVGQIPNEGSQT